MGSCSSNHGNQNGGEGFNPGNNQNGGEGFNPGGESHRPHSRQAGNMAPNAEQASMEEAAATNANDAEADAAPQAGLVSPQMGAMAPPAQPPQAANPAPQAALAGNPQGGRPWIDFDPRTNKPMLAHGQVGFQEMAGGNVPINNLEANAQAFEAAATSSLNAHGQSNFGHMENALPQLNQPYGNQLIIGAVSADVSNSNIVSEGHWEAFEAANNVMSLEEYHASL